VLVILKTRESGHDPALRELIIDNEGLHLAGRINKAGAVLTDTGLPNVQRRGTRSPSSRKKRGVRK
jgi:circadian clock protein KaiC